MNESNATGVLNQTKGKIKEAIGNATGNERLANSGAADQVKGHAQEVWGNLKDTAADLHDSARAKAAEYDRESDARAEAHETDASFRDKVTAGAEHVKDSINRGLNNLEDHR